MIFMIMITTQNLERYHENQYQNNIRDCLRKHVRSINTKQ